MSSVKILFLFVFSVSMVSFYAQATQIDTNAPHGFLFGMSKKDALQQIESLGLKVKSDQKYSNNMRKIAISGSVTLGGLALLPLPDHETRLEFYKDNLMSSSILFNFEDSDGFTSAKKSVVLSLFDTLGGSFSREKVFSIEVLSWNLKDAIVLANLNPGKKTIEIEYIHREVLTEKTEKDLERKRRGDPGDPAKEMFIDNDFSAQ